MRAEPRMRVAFIGDATHPNAQNWLNGLQAAAACDIRTWSLPAGDGRLARVQRVIAWARALVGIRRMLAAWSPDLLIAYRTTSYGFLGAVSGFHPLVVAAQGETDAWPLDSWTVGIKRWMARVCLRRADLIHAWGEHIAREQLSLGAEAAKIMIRPRGVDLSRFSPRAEGPALDELRLITTRSLFPDYSHHVIIEAVAGLSAQGLRATLDIVGDGPCMPELRRQVERRGLQAQVRFHGRLANNDLPDLLRACNMYVAMPITEGVSASLLEAMACGCYPIVTDLVANRVWISSGDNGRLVRVNDCEGLQEAIRSAWSDPAALRRAVENNQRLVDNEGALDKNMTVFVQRYRALIAAHQHRTDVSADGQPIAARRGTRA